MINGNRGGNGEHSEGDTRRRAFVPDVVDQSMTRADLVYVLEHLRYDRDRLGTLKLDRGVARYLIDSLQRR